MNEKSAVGVIIGTAVGDAWGLPFENLSPVRLERLFPDRSSYRFFLGRGMVSDDTEHTCMVAQCLISSGAEPDIFGPCLAGRLKWWALLIPAGIGFGTLRAVVKLWLGFSWKSSGVWSAGNGPAMRSAVIGVFCGEDIDLMIRLVKTSTRITHCDPRAYYGALAVACAASLYDLPADEMWPRLRSLLNRADNAALPYAVEELLFPGDRACARLQTIVSAVLNYPEPSPGQHRGFFGRRLPNQQVRLSALFFRAFDRPWPFGLFSKPLVQK